jgi:hypothetical protein
MSRDTYDADFRRAQSAYDNQLPPDTYNESATCDRCGADLDGDGRCVKHCEEEEAPGEETPCPENGNEDD